MKAASLGTFQSLLTQNKDFDIPCWP